MTRYELTPQDREVLRTLAQEYMAIATSDAQLRTQQLWASLNTGNMERPMTIIEQIPWHEMDVDGSLISKIEHPYWKVVENNLRQFIYKAKHMPADMVMPPYILLPRVLVDKNYRRYGISVTEDTATTDSSNSVVSHGYINQFETMEDVAKIQRTEVKLDKEASDMVWEEASKIFAGVAPIQWRGILLHMGIWDLIAAWMSVEECYYQLIDEPELLHAIMERATSISEEWIDQANEQQLFDTASAFCHCSCTLTKPFTATPVPGTAENAWSFGMAQLFTSVSPDVTAEFETPYISRLFKKIGNTYYGCCERLDDRLDIISQLPNLRKVSCSPWSQKEAFAEKLPKSMIMSNKPNPALVGASVTFDADAYRADIRETIQAAKNHGTRLEMILKDNSSVKYQPQRLWEASRIMLEEAQNI